MTDKGRDRDKVEGRNEGNKKKGERKIGCTHPCMCFWVLRERKRTREGQRDRRIEFKW